MIELLDGERITDLEDEEARRLAVINTIDKLSTVSTNELVEVIADLHKQVDELMMQANVRRWIVNRRMQGENINREILEKQFPKARRKGGCLVHGDECPEPGHLFDMLFGNGEGPKGVKH